MRNGNGKGASSPKCPGKGVTTNGNTRYPPLRPYWPRPVSQAKDLYSRI
jgi:hypothetical protein